MYFDEFEKMAELHPTGTSATGRYEMRHVDVQEPSMMDRLQNPEYGGQLAQTVCVLKDTKKNEIVMSDSWMEQQTNIDAVLEAHGHVLVGGLGMGMILLGLQNNPKVESITVVEIDQEMIDFIVPNLPLGDKVKVINNDIFAYKPTETFDTVYCDIWNDISANNLEDMEELTEKFSSHCDATHWRYKKTKEMWEEENGYEEEYEFY